MMSDLLRAIYVRSSALHKEERHHRAVTIIQDNIRRISTVQEMTTLDDKGAGRK